MRIDCILYLLCVCLMWKYYWIYIKFVIILSLIIFSATINVQGYVQQSETVTHELNNYKKHKQIITQKKSFSQLSL